MDEKPAPAARSVDRSPDCRIAVRPLEPAHALARAGRALDVWRAQCAGAAMPDPGLARFDTFTFAIGRLHLIEIREAGRYFFRVFGTMGGQHVDFHRREISQIRPPAFRELIERGIAAAVAAGAPLLDEITIEIPRRRCRYQRLILPYGPPAGPPTLLLVCVAEESEKEVAEVFRDPMFAVPAGTAAAR